MESVDAVVVGAGVVGLAIARALAAAGREVLILESEDHFGTHTSSRNSEVIHAGIYYPPGSLKGRLCVRGKDSLYRYCQARGIGHRRIGKVLVAVDEAERAQLAHQAERAAVQGVRLEPLSAAGVARLEPAVRAVAGLWSESTGIIDSHALMLALLGDAEAQGAVLVLRSPVAGGAIIPGGGFCLEVGGDAPMRLSCRILVNSAGLKAQALAARLQGLAPHTIAPTHYAKGHYFTLSGRSPFRHLVYPMPNHAGLGIHVTLDLAGQCRFGPDVSGWPVEPDYGFEPGLQARFEQAIRRYWPDLPQGALQPGYTGIRPKVSGPDQPAGDFIIQGPAGHGVSGLVNLYGIESPGLTACLAISEEVLGHLGIDAHEARC